MTKKLIALVVCSAVVAGCAVTQETTPVQVQLDGSVAKAQASALSTAVASANANDGIGIAQAVASIGDVSAALLPPTKSGGKQRITPASTTCTCDAAAKSCTFSACTIGAATVTGSLSWSGGQILCSGLKFEVPATSAALGAATIAVDCAVTYGATQLAGNLSTTGTAVVDTVTYAWSAKLDATDVTFTTSAFTGGSIAVDATVTSSSVSAADQTYAAAATIALP